MNDVVEYGGADDRSLVERDDVIAIARHAEERLVAVQKIKQISLMTTNAGDWVDQNGRPYLMASGAEKIAGVFQVSWRFLTPEPTCLREADGHFTYSYRAEFSMGGRTIEVEGSRSSRDKFFAQYTYEGKEKSEKDVSARDNERDVRMAAFTNLLGNGITRILGIRNLTYADLQEYGGIAQSQIGKVEYKKGGEAKPAPAMPARASAAPAPKAPAPPMPTSVCLLKAEVAKEGKNAKGPWTLYALTTDGGQVWNSFSRTVYDHALVAIQGGVPVELVTSVGADGRTTVTEVRVAGAADESAA